MKHTEARANAALARTAARTVRGAHWTKPAPIRAPRMACFVPLSHAVTLATCVLVNLIAWST